ncbi:calcineurin-like phosphoesterase C-terminal domain-containing protein [Luteimonas sp. RIT-PG2_3]
MWLADGRDDRSDGSDGSDGGGDRSSDRSQAAGIAGVQVSDGRRVVRTDARGRYPALAPLDGHVFIVKPAGYTALRRDDGLPDTWRRIEPAVQGGDAPACGDFALRRAPTLATPDTPDTQVRQAVPRADDPLRLLVFSDPQAGTQREVDYYLRDIAQPASRQRGISLGLTLGDVGNDAPALYPALNAATTSIGVPWLHVAGNHDMDVGARSDGASLSSFKAVYGPDTYAWEETQASFVVLDNVIAQPGQRPAYVGGLREDQLDFLTAYLAQARRERLLVIAVHIPWFDTATGGAAETVRARDRERLFALLQPFPHVLLLSGHRHTQQHVRHGAASGWHGAQPLHEYNVGAACGAFWSGAADAAGIPDATMADGTPNGYATMSVATDAAYALAWHPARRPQDDPGFTDAMRLHAPKVLRRGAYPAFGVYANVFMGEDDTRVEYRVADGDWQAMRRVSAPDPWLRAENARDDQADALRGFDRSPEAEPSTHLWRGALPTDLEAGEHAIEVRVFDRWQGEQRAQLQYRLDEAAQPE